ncbi:MAG: Rieske 2Fe-2S domain-containing protein [Acidobacteria bacterium]|nr:Rieske 2Fe-2S domain-containing protein [Acidobacteriota bacterium]
MLTSAAMTAGQIWIAVQAWLHRRADVLPARRITSLDDLDVGGVLAFTYPTEHDPCLLIRVGESDLVAYSQKCTHLSCAVVPRPEEGILHCPCHNGAFALDDGRPIAGPPSRPLPAVELEVRGRDVYAVGVTVRTV